MIEIPISRAVIPVKHGVSAVIVALIALAAVVALLAAAFFLRRRVASTET